MELFRSPGVLLWAAAFALLSAPYLAWVRRRKRRMLSAFGDPDTVLRLIPSETVLRQRWSLALQLTAAVLFFIGLAGPQWGVELVESRSKSRQLVVAIDVSLSMAAEDLTPNRLERAKSEMAFLADRLGDARIGVIAFSGRAYVQCPLTVDRNAVKILLRSMRVDMLPEPGTKVAEPVKLAAKMLEAYPGEKGLVLITDGEDHGGGLAEAAAVAKATGLKIHTLVASSAEGAPIPVRDENGVLSGYKKDKNGQTVVSRADEKGMAELSAATGGLSMRLAAGASSDLIAALDELARTDAPTASRGRYRDRYQWPLALGWLCLFAAWLLPEHARRRSKDGPVAGAAGRAGKAAKAGLSALLVLALAGPSSAKSDAVRKGAKLYKDGDFKGAAAEFERALREDPRDNDARLGLGSARYELGQFDQAQDAFESAAKASGGSPDALYNLGNAQFRKTKPDDAAKSYKEALLKEPDAADIRHNYAVALIRSKQKPPPPKDDKKDPDKKDQDKKGGGGDSPPPPAPPKPKSGMTPDDARRVLQAIQEREKTPQAPKKQGGGKSKNEEDW